MNDRAGRYDAIVIGGGHNGLVCAAYLAKARLRTLVLERRERIGGMAATGEPWPGVRVPTLAHTVGRLRPGIARELALREHGLRLVEPDVRVFAPQADGRAIALHRDVGRTVVGLAANSLVGGHDADRYAAVDAEFRGLARALSALLDNPPPDLASPSLGDIVGGVRRLAKVRARTPDTSAGLMRVMPMAVRDLVEEWFESDALRALIASRGVLLTAFGPRMPGTSGVLLTDTAGNDGGLAGRTVFAQGGPGALSEALAAAARSYGAQLRSGAPVARVRTHNAVATGVTLDDGQELDADVVVSTLDPKTTLLGLLEPEALGPRLSWRASNIRQTGATAKVNFALRALPRFAAAAGDPLKLRGRIVLAPSMDALERATDPVKYGRVTHEPLIEATIPSLVDSSLIDTDRAGPIRHVLSAIVQSAPRDLRDAVWNDERERLGDLVTAVLERYAPGFGDLVEARQVVTPQDIELEYGNEGGHPMHAEVGLDQWFEWRPLHGFGRYRMPVRGLYLAGAGAHPGGGVTGGPGQLGAREVLADVRQGRLRVSA